MRRMKWIGVVAAVILIISCFTPWVIIDSKNITVSGIKTTGTDFGKPGYFHFITSFFFLLFSFIHTVWAKRWNLAVAGLNIAWAVRNYFIISACHGGDCPVKQSGLYIILLASAVMMLAALFPDIKLTGQENEE